MRILFITLRAPEINSSVTISNIGLLKGLKSIGHEIVLLTPKVSEDIEQYELVKDLYDNIKVVRFGENKLYNRLVGKDFKKGIRKKVVDLLRFIYYKFSLYDNTLNLVRMADIKLLCNERFDLVISTSDPKTSHLFAKKLIEQGLNYKYWLQHWGDPLYYDITRSSWIPKMFIKRKENEILKKADYIVYVSPLTLKVQKYLFPSLKNKMFFIPLPYEKVRIYNNKNNYENLKIGYFGDYNSKIRDVMPLYRFCESNDKYSLIMAGSTDLSLRSSKNIKIYPRVSQEQVNDMESQCDVLAIVCNTSGTQIPGKIYYYAATNQRILILLDGDYKAEIKEYLSKFNRFIICENNPSDIKYCLENIHSYNVDNKPCDAFSSVSIANEIINIINMKG